MNAQRPQPAAFKGTFAGFALIKGRKVARFDIEVAIEDADAALEAMGGLPRSDTERWVAVALLKSKPEERASANGKPPEFESGNEGSTPSARAKPAKERRPWDTMTRAQQAGVLCNDEQFQRWLLGQVENPNETDAASIVRLWCGVESRRYLDTNDAARREWDRIVSEYRAATGQLAEARG